MEFLKDFLDEETYSKVESQLKGNDKVKIANLKDGTYVAKDKYDTLQANFDTVQGDLTNRNKDLEELKKNTPKDQQEAITALQTKYNEDTEALNKKLKENKLDSAMQLAIIKAGAKDDVAVRAHLNEFMSKATLDENTNSIVGMEDQLKTLKETKEYLFEESLAGGQSHKTPPKKDELEEVSLGSALAENYK